MSESIESDNVREDPSSTVFESPSDDVDTSNDGDFVQVADLVRRWRQMRSGEDPSPFADSARIRAANLATADVMPRNVHDSPHGDFFTSDKSLGGGGCATFRENITAVSDENIPAVSFDKLGKRLCLAQFRDGEV
jgi:hypothetical protein